MRKTTEKTTDFSTKLPKFVPWSMTYAINNSAIARRCVSGTPGVKNTPSPCDCDIPILLPINSTYCETHVVVHPAEATLYRRMVQCALCRSFHVRNERGSGSFRSLTTNIRFCRICNVLQVVRREKKRQHKFPRRQWRKKSRGKCHK